LSIELRRIIPKYCGRFATKVKALSLGCHGAAACTDLNVKFKKIRGAVPDRT